MEFIHSSFRAAVSQALRNRGVSVRFFRDECDYDALLEDIDLIDDPRRIAVAALIALCKGNGRPIDQAVMMAMVEYLDRVLLPVSGSSRVDRLNALVKRYLQCPTEEHSYLDWISLYYK